LLFGGSKPYSSSAGGIIDCRTPVKTAETMAALGAVQFSKEVGFLYLIFFIPFLKEMQLMLF